MFLRDIVGDLEIELICGDLDTEIKDVTNDSRKVVEGGLYFAVPGAKVDGAVFIPDVIRAGAAAIVTEKAEKALENLLENDMLVNGNLDEETSLTIIEVENIRYAMGVMSSKFYDKPSEEMTIIGITGTKGKTTTTYMVKEMLELAGIKTGLIGTIEIDDGKEKIPAVNTTPESITIQKKLRDMSDNGCEAVVMEVSSQGLMLDRVAGIEFDFGIFTNLSPDHIGPNEHDSYENYKECKKKLFSICKTGIYNIDDPEAEYMMDGSTAAPITYGKNEDADYIARGHKLYQENGILGIEYDIDGTLEGHVRVALPGDFSIYNSMAATIVADCMGVSFDEIKRILEMIKVRGRVEMIPISDAFTLMIDYAHNGMSLESLLKAIREYEPERLVTLFGCGGNRAKARRYEMGEVSAKYADFTIITSDNPRDEEPQAILDDIKSSVEKAGGAYIDIIDRKEAIRFAIMNAKEGDVIILAGKGHEDYQEIHGVKHHMDERDLIREILEEEDVGEICGYNNRYFTE
ncbi:UDP-N-acetylmuramoylalanyl-D-glutamate--2,6-diaminopimelate ligase [Lachnospiraceae bacterium NE2001]|nr:UDP-N-acetylmuramoylalanyl-D-glutamate--2,6-diaminopimelate ligase [Lachnospiraceae bacterium NE2001]